MRSVKAEQCGHTVGTFNWSASCEDGVIRNLFLAPRLCETCVIMREANGIELPAGSMVVGFQWDEYSGQQKEWREELKRRDAIFAMSLPHICWKEQNDGYLTLNDDLYGSEVTVGILRLSS